MTGKRSVWKGLCALLLGGVLASVACSAENGGGGAPILRVGLMTDTHWSEKPASFGRTEAALAVFKREKVDLICNIGDIADLHYPEAYRYYRRKLFPAVFPDGAPPEIFIYANHDALTHDKHGSAVRRDTDGRFAAMRRELGIANAPNDRMVLKGYPFVIFQQFVKRETMEKMLAETAKEFPEGPIFVLDHMPAARFGQAELRRSVYSQYPRIVHIYGHIHVPLRDENSIWQGSHTEIGAGCLQNWRGSLVGTAPPSKNCFEFAIMDVFKDKLIYRRFSTEDGREFKEPWIIPLPFDPKTAPWRIELRREATPAPEFADGAALTLTPDRPFSALELRWPATKRGGEDYQYQVRIERKEADGEFHPLARQDCYSEFYLAENRRKGELTQRLSSGFFDAGRQYRISVTPVGFFGKRGAPLTAEFTAPAETRPAQLVFESRDPMKELTFVAGLTGDTPMPLKDGFYIHRGGDARLVIPKRYWEGPVRTRFRFTVEMTTSQPNSPWTIVLRNAVPLKNANNRIRTLGGKVENQRYVIEFAKRRADFFYDLLIREGGPGKIRFNYVKLEQLP